MLAGLMLLAIGFLRLGTYIKFIPYPVTVGFTAGIAVIIFASQIKDLLGLTLAGPEPGALLAEAAGALARAADARRRRPSRCRCATIAVIVGLQALAAALAGHADRGRAAPLVAAALLALRRRDHRHALRRHPARLAAARRCRDSASAKVRAVLPNAVASRCSARSSRCSRRWSPTA